LGLAIAVDSSEHHSESAGERALSDQIDTRVTAEMVGCEKLFTDYHLARAQITMRNWDSA
jgi:hypothetical protein